MIDDPVVRVETPTQTPDRGHTRSPLVGWRLPALFFLTLLAVVGAGGVIKGLPDRSLVVEVELTVPVTGVAEVYLNVRDELQVRQSPVSLGRQTLEFGPFEAPISSLRVDPLNVANQEVLVHRIAVETSDGDVLLELSPAAFDEWAQNNVARSEQRGDAFAVVGVTADSSIETFVAVSYGEGRRDWVNSIIDWARLPWPGMMYLLPPAAAVLILTYARRLRALPVVVVGSVVSVVLGVRLAGSIVGDTPADQAFGQLGWLGHDVGYPQKFLLAAGASLATAALVFVAVDYLFRRFPFGRLAVFAQIAAIRERYRSSPRRARHAFGEPVGREPKTATTQLNRRTLLADVKQRIGTWLPISVAFLPLVLYGLIILPSARTVADRVEQPMAPQSWDDLNIRTWDHLFADGLVPMRDFFYPYGNLIYLRAGLAGSLLNWFGVVLCVAAIGTVLWKLSHRVVPVAVSCLGIAVVNGQFFTGGFRYLWPIAVIVSYGWLRRESSKWRWLVLACAAFSGWIALDVGLYVVAGIAALIVVDELGRRERTFAPIARRVVVEAGVFAPGWLSFAAYLALTDRLGATSRLVLDQSATATWVGSVYQVGSQLRAAPVGLFFFLPFGLLSVAAYGVWRSRLEPRSRAVVAILGGLGAYSGLVLSKNLVRAGLEGTLALIAIAALGVVLCAAESSGRRVGQTIASGCLAGALVLQASAGGWWTQWRDALTDSPDRFVELARAATTERDRTPWFRSYLTEAQLALYPDEREFASAFRQESAGGRLYVLGDGQFLYPLTGQVPYWTVSVYETSPVQDQRRVLRELENDRPTVVAFNHAESAFDGVPNVLRTPLVYRWVIENYRVKQESAKYDLLVPLGPGESIDWAYWQRRIGNVLGVGRLGAAVPADREPCGAERSSCLTYLEVEVQPVDVPTPRSVDLVGRHGRNTLGLVQRPGDTVLTLPVERLWFWGDDTNVDAASMPWSTGYELVEIEDGDFLY